MKLVNFDDLPSGARFIYPNDPDKKVLVVLGKHRVHSNTEPLSGTLAEWIPTPLPHSVAGSRQSLYSHIPDTEGCPQEVWMLGEEITLKDDL